MPSPSTYSKAMLAVFGLAMLVFGLSTAFWLSLAALAVSGAADMVSVVVRQTLVQLETPDAMRGRVSAVNSVFIGASNQLGEFESGATAALLGPVGSVVLGGVGTVAVALLARPARLAAPERVGPRRPGHGPGAGVGVSGRWRHEPHPRLAFKRSRAARPRAFHCDTSALRSSAVMLSRRASRCSLW